MKKLVLVALFLSSSVAFAGNAYVGVTAGSATQKMTDSGVNVTENSTAVGVHAGYQVSSIISAEAGYVQFGNASIKSSDVEIGAKPKTFYVAGVATFLATPQVGLFAKVGVAHSKTYLYAEDKTSRASINKTGTSPLFGIGASYAFSNNVSAVLEYSDFGTVAKEDGSKLKVSLVSAGLRYAF